MLHRQINGCLYINLNYFWNNPNFEIVQQAKKENSSVF
ncbi:uncharacterized protein METZ01_LOCUS260690 [marine metagenome]|uniref:Uncharacterized protein n=1 Tax=marine metagenome TaxID=408172 RepID=A0A382J7E7_9ZZZZ